VQVAVCWTLDLPAKTFDPGRILGSLRWTGSGAGGRTEAGPVEGGVRWHAAAPPKGSAVFLHGDILPVSLLWSLYESITGVTLDPWWDLYARLRHDDGGAKWIRGRSLGAVPSMCRG
jgi:hypothetical protein